jgi:hypothetical protein
VPTLPTPIQYILEFLTRAIRQEKEIKGIQTGKEVKLCLFTNVMILYLQDLKKLHQKIPRHHKQLQQSSMIKINLQKSVVFLYTNKQIEKEYGKKFHLP